MSAQPEFNPEGFAMPASSKEAFLKQHVPQDDDTGVIVRFYKKMEEQTYITKETGVYTEKPVDYINIVVRGNDKMEVDRPVSDVDKRRFAKSWADYQAGRQAESRGTPLDQLPGGMTPREIVHFHSLNVFTIEDLALVTDQHISSLGTGARERRSKAQAVVAGRQQSSETERQLTELKKQNGLLSTQLATALDMNTKLAERLDRLEAAQKEPPRKKGGE
jgi:hypothetical protein